jgi:hypothetical protein
MGCLDLCISVWIDPVEKVFLVGLFVVIFPWCLSVICSDDLFLSRFVQFLEEGGIHLSYPLVHLCVLYWPSMVMDLDFMGD